MNGSTINIGDLLNIKVYASEKVYDDLLKRFSAVKITECVCDFEIFYRNFQMFQSEKSGILMKPFRNALYLVNEQEDKIIAYSPAQTYSSENIIERINKKITISCQKDNNSKVLIRVITELLIRKLLSKGYFPLHASCVMKDNKAILFLGKKGSGKSTALFANVLLNDAYPISNDITFVGKENGKWQAFGLPYDLTFDSTLFLQIAQETKKFKNFHEEDKYGSNKIRYDVAEFIADFNTSWVWHAPIAAINIVNLTKESEYTIFSNIKFEDALLNLKRYGKDNNFDFDDYLKINNLYPSFDYELLSQEIPFNKMEGNVLRHYLKRSR